MLKHMVVKKNIKIENGQYVLLEYSELNSGTFYITDAYQAQDVEILKQQGFIPIGNDKMDTDEIVFGSMDDKEINVI